MAYALLKDMPRGPALEASLQRSDTGMWPRRKLLSALANALKATPNLNAQVTAKNPPDTAFQQLIRRMASTVVAVCVSEEEASFGPAFRAFIIETFLPKMRRAGFNDQVLKPICDALVVAARQPSHDSRESVPAESLASSDSDISTMRVHRRSTLTEYPNRLA